MYHLGKIAHHHFWIIASYMVLIREKAHKPTINSLAYAPMWMILICPLHNWGLHQNRSRHTPNWVGVKRRMMLTSNHSLSDRYSIRILSLPYNDHLFQYGGSNLFVNFPWTGSCERHFENGKGERCELPIWKLLAPVFRQYWWRLPILRRREKWGHRLL